MLLPTGSGKSLVFQLASFLLPGRAFVIEPIVALDSRSSGESWQNTGSTLRLA